jgi:energy-coupling factor transporter transmembrane protein EcfT
VLRDRLGTRGQLAAFLAVLLAAILLAGPRALLALALAVVLAVLFHPAALRIGRSVTVWVFTALLLVSGALWLGVPDARVGAVAVSRAGLAAGLWMAARALAILLAARGLAASTSPGELAGLLERAGLPGLGFTLGVAVNLLPALERSSRHTWDTLRMRGGLRHRRRAALRLATLTVMSGALRRADEIAIAAEARGFGLRHARPPALRRGRLDGPVMAALAALVALLAAWR